MLKEDYRELKTPDPRKRLDKRKRRRQKLYDKKNIKRRKGSRKTDMYDISLD